MSDNAPTTSSSHRNEPKGGTIIADRYQIDKLIARGGMAAVYLAHHVKLNRPVALKILSPPPDADDTGAFEERFRLEAETLAALDHPNIVILHDFGDLDDGRFFLAMEYIEGPRLSDVLRDGPLPCERALNLIVQVCSGLRYAHKRGVVHRDLKPSNLLIRTKDDGSEQIKVVDFGLVKLTETDQSITRAGLILGSPHCMAPEQVKGQKVDHRADIYAIGVLLFRTLTGQYPFHGPNSAATMIAHLNQPVPTFFSVAPELVVPEGLEEIVRKCLGKAPADRHQSMKDLMEDLAACMNVPPEQFRSVSQSHSTIQRRVDGEAGAGRSRAIMIALALMGILGVAGTTVVLGGLYVGGTSMNNNVIEAPPPDGGDGEKTDEGAEKAATDAEKTDGEDAEKAATDAEKTDGEDAEKTDGEDAEKTDGEDAEKADEEKVEPQPAPAPAPRPAPVRPRPQPRPAPAPAPAPAPEPAPKDDAPDGYMGMPDDLFD